MKSEKTFVMLFVVVGLLLAACDNPIAPEPVTLEQRRAELSEYADCNWKSLFNAWLHCPLGEQGICIDQMINVWCERRFPAGDYPSGGGGGGSW